ncbi:MAG: GSCFA domain-containing protein [Flavobacteriaceae bacterium]|nr:GSCFA domain-containing protein [Flavobacteriaceae bacterium]
MIFRTQIPVKKTQFQIDHHSKVLLFGSCFTESIGNRLDYFKFDNIINPFGILFHPIAIENLITNAINQKKYTEKNLFFHKEQWHCFDAHSRLSNTSKVVLLQQLNSVIKLTNKQINESTHIIITLGTAWVYRFIETDTIVANCHKILQKKFLKELLAVDEIAQSIEAIISLIKSINKKVEIIFTVSPVRHLNDGFTENSLSKAHLISAIHQIVDPINKTHYFASYEIMIDDLRDYRFYKNDMLHPNETAINYIWQQFKNTWINKKSFDLMNEIDAIQKGLSHKPFNVKSEEHQQFLSQLNRKIDAIIQKYPQIKF